MMLISTDSTPWLNIYQYLLKHGKEVKPRGQATLELTDHRYTLRPEDCFCGFTARKLNLDYIKQELCWYLGGDRHDLSICKHAATWQDCVTNGTLHSNYGHYLFVQGGLRYCFFVLSHDKTSRRATVPILASEHLFIQNRDVPCTASISFQIREDKLNMSVHMRSQDAIYGMGNDAPFFVFVQELLWQLLRPVYPSLLLGSYQHTVVSFHVYERHWPLIKDICHKPTWKAIGRPWLAGSDEAERLLCNDLSGRYKLSRWLSSATFS